MKIFCNVTWVLTLNDGALPGFSGKKDDSNSQKNRPENHLLTCTQNMRSSTLTNTVLILKGQVKVRVGGMCITVEPGCSHLQIIWGSRGVHRVSPPAFMCVDHPPKERKTWHKKCVAKKFWNEAEASRQEMNFTSLHVKHCLFLIFVLNKQRKLLRCQWSPCVLSWRCIRDAIVRPHHSCPNPSVSSMANSSFSFNCS